MDPIAADTDTDNTEAEPTGAGAPSDNTTLASVLVGLEEAGFAVNIIVVSGGRLRCGRCEHVSAAADFEVASIRRLEGASDPDEMVSVVAATCPRCDGAGAVVLGYGPTASEDDADVSVSLRAPITGR